MLADRAFGKLKEVHQIEHGPYHDTSNEELQKQIDELQDKFISSLREQGYVIEKPRPQLLPAAADDSKVQ